MSRYHNHRGARGGVGRCRGAFGGDGVVGGVGNAVIQCQESQCSVVAGKIDAIAITVAKIVFVAANVIKGDAGQVKGQQVRHRKTKRNGTGHSDVEVNKAFMEVALLKNT